MGVHFVLAGRFRLDLPVTLGLPGMACGYACLSIPDTTLWKQKEVRLVKILSMRLLCHRLSISLVGHLLETAVTSTLCYICTPPYGSIGTGHRSLQ